MRIISWLSICFIVSSETPTAISREMPPKAKPPAPAPAPAWESVPMVTATTVSPAFDTPPVAGTPWRIRRNLTTLRSSPVGQRGTFVWDSREVPGGGDVYLRLTPVDSDLGFAAEPERQHALSL